MKFRVTTLFILWYFDSLLADTTSYILYHKQCRLAETHFLNDKYEECMNTYLEVFDTYDILFPRDCFMASQIAHKIKKD